jgi:AcrR family transcriptional regulator
MNVKNKSMRADKARKHSEILSSAAKVINSANADVISLEEIAQAAQVTRATIYNHFSSREQLLVEMVLPALEYLDQGILEVEARQTGLEGLANLLCDLFENFRGILEIQSCATLRENQALREAYLGFREHFLRFLHGIPELGKDPGPVPIMRIIGETYIPILRVLNENEADPSRVRSQFNNILKGMVLA